MYEIVRVGHAYAAISERIKDKKSLFRICHDEPERIDEMAVLRAFVESIPESTGCVHGDFQGGNVILSGGKPYWIDLGRFAYGDPMFDIGHLYLSCVVYSSMKQARAIFHMEKDQLLRFWDVFARTYTGQEDHSEFDRQAARFAAVDIAVRTVYSKPTFLENLFFRYQLNSLMPNFSKKYVYHDKFFLNSSPAVPSCKRYSECA